MCFIIITINWTICGMCNWLHRFNGPCLSISCLSIVAWCSHYHLPVVPCRCNRSRNEMMMTAPENLVSTLSLSMNLFIRCISGVKTHLRATNFFSNQCLLFRFLHVILIAFIYFWRSIFVFFIPSTLSSFNKIQTARIWLNRIWMAVIKNAWMFCP